MATWRALCHSPAPSPFTGTAPPLAEKHFHPRADLRRGRPLTGGFAGKVVQSVLAADTGAAGGPR